MRSLEDTKLNIRKVMLHKLPVMVAGLLLIVALLLPHPVQASYDPIGCKVEEASVPASSSNSIDLGAGYTLVNGCNGLSIVAPPSTVKSFAPAVAPSPKSMDLGAGYMLVTDASGTRIVAPYSQVKSQDQTLQAGARVVKRVDIGDGYELQLWADGGQIVKVSP